MVFSSAIFLFLFLPVTYLVYRLLPSQSLRNGWLALASLVFYGFGQPGYVLLLLSSVLANFLFGLWLQSMSKYRKWIAGFAVIINLLALGAFKYLDFLTGIWNSLSGMNLPLAGLVLPIGISFYTFQGLSYVIDVYRDPQSGTRNPAKLLLYISFFPQLIAGPIIKYHDVSQQIDSRTLTPWLTLSGLQRFILGFAKKLLIANTAGQVADVVFAQSALDFRLAWLGAVCYTLQIYFDFSGYSDMAIGLGRIFGFSFLENFNLPYTAHSIREFWRRWHISLSSWFRDYVYIPLGGNRKGKIRTDINKFLVFFATGLWHGANWTFILWGLWHGLFATLEDIGIIPKRLRECWFGHIYTMFVVILGFTLFRADHLSSAGRIFAAMFTGFQCTAVNTLQLMALLDARTVFLLLAGIYFAAGLPQKVFARIGERMPVLAQDIAKTLAYGALFAWSVLVLAGTTFNPFIYFQF